MQHQSNKIVKRIVENNLKKDEWYIEPFVSDCNSLSIIKHNKKVGFTTNKYVISLWKDIQEGRFTIPMIVTKELYEDIKRDYIEKTNIYPKSLIGYVGFAYSCEHKWWNGYSNSYEDENYDIGIRNSFIRQIFDYNGLYNSIFINCNYKDIILTENSFIFCNLYCLNNIGYDDDFDNNEFWEWCRKQIYSGHKILIEGNKAPDDFVCIWKKETQDEKFFIHASQIPLFNVNKKI